MESCDTHVHFKGSLKQEKLTPCTKDRSDQNVHYEFTESDVESYFKSNVLLQFGILGYMRFQLRVLESIQPSNQFVLELNRECFDKLQLVAANRFPAESPIDLSCNILGTSQEYKFNIVRHNHSLSALVNGGTLIDAS